MISISFLANDDYILDDTVKSPGGTRYQTSGSFSQSLRESTIDISAALPGASGQKHDIAPTAGSLTIELAKDIQTEQRNGTIQSNDANDEGKGPGPKR